MCSGQPSMSQAGVVISPGGLATTVPGRDVPQDSLSSSALEGSQHGCSCCCGAAASCRHQPWRARNAVPASVYHGIDLVVISPGGLATCPAPAGTPGPSESSSALAGSQHEVVAGPAAALVLSSALEGSQPQVRRVPVEEPPRRHQPWRALNTMLESTLR